MTMSISEIRNLIQVVLPSRPPTHVGSGVKVILASFLAMLLLGSRPAWASQKLDSDLIPPDVTLPTTSRPSVDPNITNTPAPGTAAGAAAGGQMNPWKIPTQPQPPPVGSGSGPPPPPPGSGAPPATEPQKPDPIAIIETEKGNIVIRLFRQYAPRTVANFIELTNKGFYNGLTFHRVEPGFCIQGGCPNGNGSGVYFEPGTQNVRMLPLETNAQLKHNAAGVVAMARFPKNPNSGSCQFYITLAPQPKLDGQYSIFGGVLSGMDVVNSIAKGDKMVKVSVQEQGQ
jgi:peptidyl-prolyl cis-trans isomerase B (cyclophilin B)